MELLTIAQTEGITNICTNEVSGRIPVNPQMEPALQVPAGSALHRQA